MSHPNDAGRAHGRVSTRQRDVTVVCLGTVKLPQQLLTECKLEEVSFLSYTEIVEYLHHSLDRGVHNSAYKHGYTLTLSDMTPQRILVLRTMLQQFHLDIDLFVAGHDADPVTLDWLQNNCSVKTTFLPGVRLVNPSTNMLCPPVEQPLVVCSFPVEPTMHHLNKNAERDAAIKQLMTLQPFQLRTPDLVSYQYLYMPFVADYTIYEEIQPQVDLRRHTPNSPNVVRRRNAPNQLLAIFVNGWQQIEIFDASQVIDFSSLPVSTFIPATVVDEEYLTVAAAAPIVVP